VAQDPALLALAVPSIAVARPLTGRRQHRDRIGRSDPARGGRSAGAQLPGSEHGG